ncbi:MAG TPA: hypothetical protein VF624_07545 [Tepidisphaeraceae bacterium]
MRSSIRLSICLVLFAALSGCVNPPPPAPDTGSAATSPVAKPSVVARSSAAGAAPDPAARPEVLSQAALRGLSSVAVPGGIALSAAKNESAAFLLQIDAAADARLVIDAPAGPGGKIDLASFRAYQVLPVPVDVNRAGFVRHTGMPAAVESLPRALLPLKIEGDAIPLGQLRDPRAPAKSAARGAGSGQKLLIWIDVRIPIATTAGLYNGRLVVRRGSELASLRMDLDVLDFAVGDDRRLQMVGQLDWDTLRRHWPERFEVVRPHLLNRNEPATKSAVVLLDQLQTLAQDHRLQVHVPRLQPTVKWPINGESPKIDWTDYDSLVEPWLNGTAFADGMPLGFWPLPKIDLLDNIPRAARLQYYAAAAAHFDQREWLTRAPAVLEKSTPGRANVSERLVMSAEAARLMAAHPRIRVMLPLEPDELQIAVGPDTIDPATTARLRCVAPGLISASPLRRWPKELKEPENWLRTDMRGLIPYVGAGGDEGDVRTWAWAAFLRSARLIDWGRCLPSAGDLTTPADPNELVWFYPGSWFGVEGVVPTVQLKWLRRAQQDFEYLSLAAERGSVINVLPMARLLSKPVEIQPGQSPDPTYSLLIGTADPAAWPTAQTLLSRIIALRGPGIEPDENKIAAVNLDTLHWMEPLEQPVIVPRTTRWTVGVAGDAGGVPWANLQLGVDIYNASDTTPDENNLQFEAPLPPGWEVQPAPVAVPKLSGFHVRRQTLNARVDPARPRPAKHAPIQLQFRSGFSGQTTPMQFIAPAAVTQRRVQPLAINGSIEDWTSDDAIGLGPLVKMMNRPAVQRHELERAARPCDVYTGWSNTDFYVAFRAEGLSATRDVLAARNFVDYQFRRAWSEDVCQVLVQAMYSDGTVGPLVHLSLKPGGNLWAERRGDTRLSVEPWQNLQTATRYATTLEKDVWRGEMAIPWASLIAEEKTAALAAEGKPNLPVMLRFNFSTHLRATGESASWAGPVDSSRDENFTGVLVLKEP